MTAEQIILHIKIIKKQQRRLYKDQWYNRQKFLKDIMKKYIDIGEVAKEKIVRKIYRAEKRRNQFFRINYYVGKEKNSLNCFIIPLQKHPTRRNEDEEFIVRRKEIEQIIIARNSNHLHQAHNSEVVQSGCVAEIADEMIKYQIVDREFSTDKNEDFNELIQGFKRKVESRPNVITEENLTRVCKGAKGGKVLAYSIISYRVLKCLSDSK